MSLLLNDGNVRLKIFCLIKNTFRRSYDHFILLSAGRDILCLAEILRLNPTYKILAFSAESRQSGDEFFYQEVLYRFCRDRNLHNLPVFVALENDVVIKKQFDFPEMPQSDIKKAVSWELSDWKKDCICGYAAQTTDTGCKINAVLAERKYLAKWRRIITEQNLYLSCVFYAEEKSFDDDLVIIADDDELMTYINGNDRQKLKCLLQNLAHCTQINLNEKFCRMTYLNWRNIALSLGICLTVFSSFITGFYVYDYIEAKELQAVSAQQLQLKQKDSDLIDELKQQENIIKYKQDALKNIYAEDTLFYPLLINLSADTVKDVKLVFAAVKERHVQLKGKAADYAALSAYKAALERIKFVRNVKIDDTKLDEADNLIDFTLYFDEVK